MALAQAAASRPAASGGRTRCTRPRGQLRADKDPLRDAEGLEQRVRPLRGLRSDSAGGGVGAFLAGAVQQPDGLNPHGDSTYQDRLIKPAQAIDLNAAITTSAPGLQIRWTGEGY